MKSEIVQKLEREKVLKWLAENEPLPLLIETASKLHAGDSALLTAHILAAHSIGLADSCDPLHLYTVGKSGKGKGHCANAVLKLFSNNRVVPLASFSPKAFFYASKREGFNGKIVHSPEVVLNKADEDKAALLRILTDSPSNNLRAEHWTLNEKKELVKLQLNGRVSFWFNSETPVEDSQIKNRVLLGNPNESEAQDELVFDRQLEEIGRLQIPVKKSELDFVRQVNEELLGERFEVFVPFIKAIEFSGKSNRRLFPMFMTLLKATTKINALQRPSFTLVGGGRSVECLVAYPEDFAVAAWIWNELFPVTLSQVSHQALKVLDELPIGYENAVPKTAIAESFPQLTADWVYRKLRELTKAGLCEFESRDRRFYYWREASRSTRTHLGVRANSSNLSFNWLNEAFSVISESFSRGGALDKIIAQYPLPLFLTPSSLKPFVSASTTHKKQKSSESEINRDSPSSPSEAKTIQPSGVSFVRGEGNASE